VNSASSGSQNPASPWAPKGNSCSVNTGAPNSSFSSAISNDVRSDRSSGSLSLLNGSVHHDGLVAISGASFITLVLHVVIEAL
jgi:hypothetical protein